MHAYSARLVIVVLEYKETSLLSYSLFRFFYDRDNRLGGGKVAMIEIMVSPARVICPVSIYTGGVNGGPTYDRPLQSEGP